MKLILSLTLVLASTAASHAQSYRWHLGSEKNEVAYGIPETDDRLLRLRCIGPGQLELSGPLPADEDDPQVREGARALVTAKTHQTGGARDLSARVEERGDGWNYVAKVNRDHPVVIALMANESVSVIRGKYGGEIPTQGAGKVVKRLLDNCGPGKK